MSECKVPKRTNTQIKVNSEIYDDFKGHAGIQKHDMVGALEIAMELYIADSLKKLKAKTGDQ